MKIHVRFASITSLLLLSFPAISSAEFGFNEALNFNLGTGSSYSTVAAGDFNSDGKDDIVKLGYGTNTVQIHLGNSNIQSGFTPGYSHTFAYSVKDLRTGDINGDGLLDATVTKNSNNTGEFAVLFGTAGASFQIPQLFSFGQSNTNIGKLLLADINGDGRLDAIAPRSQYGAMSILVLINQGNGSFTSEALQSPVGAAEALGISFATIYAIDLNGDSIRDLAVSYNNYPPANTSIKFGTMLGNGDGSFQPLVLISNFGNRAIQMAPPGDVDNDGDIDVVFAMTSTSLPGDYNSNPIYVLRNNGNGTFILPAERYENVGQMPGMITLRDLNWDNHLDIVAPNFWASTLSVLLNSGGDGFEPPLSYEVGVPNGYFHPDTVAMGDFDGDQDLDVLTSGYDQSQPAMNASLLSSIVGPNNLPVIDPIPNVIANTGIPFEISLHATDAEGSPLILNAGTPRNGYLPVGATFNDQGDGTATLAWTPGKKQAGTYVIVITADDGYGVSVLAFNINVRSRLSSGSINSRLGP